MTTTIETAKTAERTSLRFLALDITRTCQATCAHCYNESGPTGEHGKMTRKDWSNVLGQASRMGVTRVQFIGGEATLHPDVPELVHHALGLGMSVEVFSNLIHVRPMLWPVLRQRGVTLATSYYSDRPEEHDKITQQRGSYERTRANLVKALGFRIPVRAALVDVLDGQRLNGAAAELRALGVTEIRTDRVRGIGRGAGADKTPDPSELCGYCTKGQAAVMPNGDVGGCVMSGAMMVAGNVLTTPLTAIVGSQAWRDIAARIPQPQGRAACVPDSCTPKEDSCQPSPGTDLSVREEFTATGYTPNSDGDGCSPAEQEACNPAYK
jgi:MoaA/NifB/PqqE/SkfB family radical SAM enzyme